MALSMSALGAFLSKALVLACISPSVKAYATPFFQVPLSMEEIK